jgi:hypothetical protein
MIYCKKFKQNAMEDHPGDWTGVVLCTLCGHGIYDNNHEPAHPVYCDKCHQNTIYTNEYIDSLKKSKLK